MPIVEERPSTVPAPPPPPFDPEALFAEARRRRRRRRLGLAAIAVVVLAFAGGLYVALGDGAVRNAASGGGAGTGAAAVKTIVLLVDVSGSMRAEDVKPTRLDATTAAMRAFVDRLPDDVGVGLVAFSSDAEVVQAPTLDRARVRRALATLEPRAGTALGDGLAAATALATRESGRYLPAAIVLESDGAQTRGRTLPLQAAREAKAAGIPVYGIALGKPSGAVKFGYGLLVNSIPVPPDPAAVRSISRTTGGAAFVAHDAAALASAYRQIAARLS